MKTALTEILGIEAPVMLAGMGGVSYHQLAAAVSEAGGFGCLGASTMGDDEMVAEIAARMGGHVKGLGNCPHEVGCLERTGDASGTV